MELHDITTFFSFSNHSLNVVILGTVLLGITTAVVGCFSFLQKRALIGDAISHSILPGVCVGFMISGSKNPIYLISFSVLSGLLSVYFMDFIKRKSKLKNDTALAVTLSFFFGVGLMLLSVIQNSGNAAQSGVDQFLFGQAAAMLESDLIIYGTVCLITLIIVIIFFKAFSLVSFDVNFGKSIGLPVRLYQFLLTTITVIAVAVGIQTVGVVLMAAMLITPASGARFWTNNMKKMVLISGVFGGLSGVFGAFISFILPNMPTGPWVIVCLSALTTISILFAPSRGILYGVKTKKSWNDKLNRENILKAFYHIGEPDQDFEKSLSMNDVIFKRYFTSKQLTRGLKQLKKENKLTGINGKWTLTLSGLKEGKRLAKIHRLWEIYLTKYLNIAADHVHDDAESIEHVITPELEKELEKMLGYPEMDPHEKEIPYE